MQRRLGSRQRLVDVAARQVEQVAVGELALRDRRAELVGRDGLLFDRARERQRPGAAVQAPVLDAGELEDEHVVRVVVGSEPLCLTGSEPNGE